MRLIIFIGLFVVTNCCQAQLSSPEVRGLKSGRIPDDTSYVYTLPYEAGKGYVLVQGSNSSFSHKGELAYDFKMKTGTPVCAARGGVVVSLRSDSREGGLKDEHLSDGNYIVIQHADNSRAYYWHLQTGGVTVAIGDSVKQGERIGFSGNTGYSAFPHLHFQVVDAQSKEILVRFATKKGSRYLRPGRSYRRPA
ncbi:MAG TPA: M23 family metallopeptidase [Flavisolibacter sp.]